MDEAGRPVFERLADRGMARLAPGEFPFVLADLLADLLADAGAMGALDVLVCGMAGARHAAAAEHRDRR
ncbi:MAG: 2-dehydro-3-deoxygalactonokinase, partial [Cucumibacter sp.]